MFNNNLKGNHQNMTNATHISRFDMSLRRRTGSGQNRYATKTL